MDGGQLRKSKSPAVVAVFFLLGASLLFSKPSFPQFESSAPDTARPVAAPPAPITDLVVRDKPNDHGHAFVLSWTPSADDTGGRRNVVGYGILRTPAWKGPFKTPEETGPEWHNEEGTWWRLVEGESDTVGRAPAGAAAFELRGGKARQAGDYSPDHVGFSFRILSLGADGSASESALVGPVESSGQWFHTGKIPMAIAVLAFGALMLATVNRARRGKEMYVRPLAGINAVDEAIGRATEMGRPILYVPGRGSVDMIGTVASLTILSRVAKKVAEHRAQLLVPCCEAVVMTAIQETVKQAYIDAGRAQDYTEDIVFYISQEQWAYVAALNGLMLRHRTATNFFLGVFAAESLMLAETGAAAGSMQIAGTDRVPQIPFFVVACDYTLIGEELFAASAYLSREPVLLGTLKAQDYAKAIFLVLLGLGVVAGLLNLTWLTDLYQLQL